MKPKNISELLVHFQGYLDMFDNSTQDYKTKARLYLESLNMDIGIGLTNMPSEFDEKPIKYEYEVTPEYFFIYTDEATKAELYRVDDHRVIDKIQVISSDGKTALPHEEIIKQFRSRIDLKCY